MIKILSGVCNGFPNCSKHVEIVWRLVTAYAARNKQSAVLANKLQIKNFCSHLFSN